MYHYCNVTNIELETNTWLKTLHRQHLKEAWHAYRSACNLVFHQSYYHGNLICGNAIFGLQIVEMGPYCSSICSAWQSSFCSMNKINTDLDKHGLEEGTLSSCSIKMQQAMKFRFVLDESRKTATSSEMVICLLVLELQSFEIWQDIGNVLCHYYLHIAVTPLQAVDLLQNDAFSDDIHNFCGTCEGWSVHHFGVNPIWVSPLMRR